MQMDSISFIKVDPSLFSKVRFDKFVGNSESGFLKVDSGTKKTITVVAPITHAARMTDNRTIYQPRTIYSGTSTLISPAPKPILLNHNSSGDPIGRIKHAIYEPINHEGLGLRDAHLLSYEDTFKLFKKMIVSGLVYDTNFTGLGHIMAEMNIADESAIEKFLDERYMNFSISATSNRLLDPHNGLPFAPWFSDEDELDDEGNRIYSPNVLGQDVDGMPFFVALDEMRFKEVSVVNVPADELAIVQKIKQENFADSANVKYTPYGVTGDYVINIFGTGDESIMDKSTDTKLTDENQASEVAGELAIQDSNINTEKDAGSKTDTATEVFDFESITDSSSDDEVYAAMELIMDELSTEGVIATDAKLSAEQRRELPSSAFCGPGRSFPVPDCAHATAARRLLDRSKLSSSQKQRVLTCVNRKAKSLGCNESKDNLNQFDSLSVLEQLQNLSDYDLSVFCDSLFDALAERGFDAASFESANKLFDSASNSTDVLLRDAKIAELELAGQSAQEQIDSLSAQVKSYASIANVICRTIADNLEMESLESAIDEQKALDIKTIQDSVNSFVSDATFTERLKQLNAGFDGKPDASDSTTNVDPSAKTAVANSKEESAALDQIKMRYNSLVQNSGETAAHQYLDRLCSLDIIDSVFVSKLTAKDAE